MPWPQPSVPDPGFTARVGSRRLKQLDCLSQPEGPELHKDFQSWLCGGKDFGHSLGWIEVERECLFSAPLERTSRPWGAAAVKGREGAQG